MALMKQSREVLRWAVTALSPRSLRVTCQARPFIRNAAVSVGRARWHGVRQHATTASAPVAGVKAKPLTAKGDISDVQLNVSNTSVEVTWTDGNESSFHSLWLRYNCHCKDCLEEHTGQRMHFFDQLDPDATLQSAQREGDKLIVKWEGKDKHTGYVPVQFLKQYDHSSTALKAKKAMVAVNTFAQEIPEIQYKEVVASDEGLYQWLRKISDFGFCVVKGVPTEDEMVAKMAGMIGPLQRTIYDDTFDVIVSEDQLTNIAYGAGKLGFHQDLLYYESPPGLQFLHCLKFDSCVTGGESLILDLFKVAEDFRKTNPHEFAALATIPATFQKIHYGRHLPVHMCFSRPLISLNAQNELVGVYWEPAHEGPIEVPEEQVEAFYRAHIAFAKAVNTSPDKFEFRMEEGDLLVFNNRRMLHDRNAFVSNGGQRHLKGTYLTIDHFKSKLNVLSYQVGDGRPCKRVGDSCKF